MLNLDKFIVLSVFCLVYLFLIFSKRYRGRSVWCGILCLTVAGVLDITTVIKAINWNVIAIFAGTLIVADLFIYSRVPALLSDILIDKSKTVGWAIILVCAVSGAVSAFVENVATVLIVAPIALELARRLGVSAKPFLIGIAISSNLQGTSTLIGDPPSMIFAAHEKMTFNDFFVFHWKPSIFFAIQAGAIPAFGVLYLLFRKYRQPIVQLEVEKVKSWAPAVLLIIMIFALAFSSKYDPGFRWLGGTECMALAVLGLMWSAAKNRQEAVKVIKSYDWSTTVFLAGVFVLVESLTQAGIIDSIAVWLSKMVGHNKFLAFSCIVWASVLFSAF
ncbi:MAG: TRAP transporter large permease subunit, partial [Planctomycetes bacterium]|nr:TRAP transporter large permease subunit [Planctomycetota bacterium]